MIFKVGLIFYCYSVDLRNYLYRNGIKYEVCGLNPNNYQMFWGYIRDKQLELALDNWTNEKASGR